MQSFTCHACSNRSRVGVIKVESGQTTLICEHCSAENIVQDNFVESSSPDDAEIVGIRSDGITVEWSPPGKARDT